MAFTQVPVTGTYELADGTPAAGAVRFTPTAPMHNDDIVIAAPVVAVLDQDGALSTTLAATDDAGTLPTGVGYRVELVVAGQPAYSYVIVVPESTVGALDLADAVPATLTAAAVDTLTQTQADALYQPLGAPLDGDLETIAGLTPANNDLLQRKSGAWANRTPTQVKTDLALSSVDNTSDAAKPVSTAQQTALDGKAALSHAHAGADITSGTVPVGRLPTGSSGTTVALGNHTHTVGGALVFNVKDYGALGDASADDTTEIQAAIGACNTAGGGIVFFPAGSYKVSSTLTVYSNMHLVGAGRGATGLFLANGSNTDLLKSSGFDALTTTESAGGLAHFGLRDITLDGNRANQTTGTGAGLKHYGALITMDRVVVRRFRGDGIYSEWNPGATDAVEDGCEGLIRGVTVHDCGGTGFNWAGPHDTVFTDCIAFSNATAGFWMKVVASLTQCHSWSGATAQNYAFLLDALTHLTNCQGEGATTAMVACRVSDCQVTGGMYYAGNITLGKGILIGDATHTGIVATKIDTKISNCPSGAIDYTYSGGYSSVSAVIYGTTGVAVVGTPPGTDQTKLTVLGGVSGGHFTNTPGELTVTSSGGVDMVDVSALEMSLVNGTDLIVYQSAYTTPTVKLYSQTGGVRPGTATGLGGTIFSGSGAPTASATTGDFYFRTDSATTNQRLYRCTGGTSWTGIL